MKTQNFNVAPYYDDYDTSKKFHRILFNPGFAVQARELTQLQTLLQSQIGRHGDHIFANGSVVQNGQLFLDKEYDYVKLQADQTWSDTLWTTQIQNNIISSGTTPTDIVKAKVLNYTPALATTLTGRFASTNTTTITGVGTLFLSELEIGSHLTLNGTENKVTAIASDTSLTVDAIYGATFSGVIGTRTDPGTLFIKYLTGNSVTTDAVFPNGAALSVNGYTVTSAAATSTGTGSAAHIDEGIYYTDGFFVLVSTQTLILDKYNNTPSWRIGLTKTETNTTHQDDSSLLDPAQGTYNYLAPGAHRYTITLTLTKKALTATNDGSFIEIMRTDTGTLEEHIKYPIYSEIEQTLARRTFDESGNYTVKTFGIHYEAIAGDTANIAAKLSPGKAYVRGHEFETHTTESLTFAKAQTSQAITGADTYCQHGNYVVCNQLTGFFRTDTFETVNLRQKTSASNGYTEAIIGTAKVRHILHDDGTPVTAAESGYRTDTYKIYLFDIQFTAANTAPYSQATGIYKIQAPGSGATAYIANTGRKDTDGDGVGNAGGDAILYESQANSLVWAMPNEAIKRSSITNVSYRSREVFTAQTFVAGVLTMTVASALQDFFGAGTTLTLAQKQAHFHVVVTGGGMGTTSLVVGDVIDFDKGGTRSITVDAGGNSATLDIGNATFTGNVSVIATMENDEPTAQNTRSKTLISGNATVSPAIAATTDLPNGRVVIASGYTDLATNPDTTLSLNVADVHRIVAIYEDAVAVDDDTVAGTDISSRFTLDNGQRDNLYDHASIRLIRGQTAPTGHLLVIIDYFTHAGSGYFTQESYTGSGLTDDYADIPRYSSPSTGKVLELRDSLDFRPRRDDSATTVTGNMIPYPGEKWEGDYDFYLPRIDKIYIDENRNLGIITGIPSLIPTEPNDLPRAMTLYTVDVPAYTFDPTDISTTFHNNRRYTMRDIGQLDKRIQKVEYYTSLNLLEKAATDLTFLDDAGLDRFKNGILVDPFRGHNIGDVENEFYTCSIDFAKSELRPPFSSNNVSLRNSHSTTAGDYTGETQATKTGDLVTLPYDSIDYISQTQASKAVKVNPFNIMSFVGSLTLSPPSDFWVDVTTRPDIIINTEGTNDAWEFISNTTSSAGFGTQWGDWNTIWTGEEILSSKNIIKQPLFTASGRRRPVITQRTQVSVTENQTRSGLRTTFIPDTILDTVQDRVIDRGVVPFIRTQTISVSATGLKPLTQVFPFFDGTDVSAVCNSGDSIYTDVNGAASFNFIPASGTFRTGSRMFRLIDESTNTISDAKTHAEEIFQAQGTLETRQSTRFGSVRREVITDERTVANVIQRENVIKWTDPLAQTFLVDAKEYPRGLVLSNLQLYFAEKPTSTDEQLPITIQIRETENGYPTQRIIPFSTVVANPSAVNVATSDATYADSPTTFSFSSPVFLPAGEYAIVLMTNSQDYRVYVAELGETILGTTRTISKQPYNGVFFKSQNASTWTAIQTEDLAFVLQRCSFSSLTAKAVFNNETGNPAADIRMDTMQLGVEEIQQDNATIAWEVKTTGRASGTIATDWTSVIVNEDHNHTLQQKLTSTIKSFQARATLTSDNEAVSPIIDVQRLNVIAVENLINNFSTGETNPYPTLPDGASAPADTVLGGPRARYISRRVNLTDESNDLRVFLTAHRPPGSSIDVYYKILSPVDESNFENKSWVAFTQVTSENLYATDESQAFEYEYAPAQSLTSPATPVTYTVGSVTYTSFNQFAIKIVMRSSNSTRVPKILDLRAIALAPPE